MKKETTITYLAYLLRLWRDDETAPWRVTLEAADDGKRFGFASLKMLFLFLEKQTGAALPDKNNEKE